jgi:5-methylcytosine-specific restriction endonuclease McrA
VARRADTPCSLCGKLLFRSRSSLPPERMTCHGCRSTGVRRKHRHAGLKPASNRPIHQVSCPCGVQVMRLHPATYCSKRCAQRLRPRTRTVADEQDRRSRRRALERTAPGLNQMDRVSLLARWKRQGRQCWACVRPGSTVDHLVPLSRGGTNHEGNLAPACKAHNSSRGSALIVEWRYGKTRGSRLARRLVVHTHPAMPLAPTGVAQVGRQGR